MSRAQYPSDVTEEQWKILHPLIPGRKPGPGRPPLDRREVLNAILYVNRTGCHWRALPHDFPCWKSVYTVFWRWRQKGIWKRIHDALRAQVRRSVGKKPTPTAAIIDSQSVKTTEVGGVHGYDAGKHINGRKRHLVVDTLGLILMVVVHAAHIQDYVGARGVLALLKGSFRRLEVIFADAAYGRDGLPEWVHKTCGWILQTVLRPVGVKGFVVLPKRWIVERTFGWLGRYRRHSKDYEQNTASSEAMIYISMIHLMSRRLANRVA
jgi:putative transposase